VHLRIEEKITCVAMKDGGLDNMEVIGILQLLVSDTDCDNIAVRVDVSNPRGAQMQVSTGHSPSSQLAYDTSISAYRI